MVIDCESCSIDFELKSQSKSFGKKIVDGAFKTMIERLNSERLPNLFLLQYSKQYYVVDFFVIPNYFISPSIIEKRSPLSNNARRAGWIGCNLLINDLPESSRIYLLRQGKVEPREGVIDNWKKSNFLGKEKLPKRGWLIDMINCIDEIPTNLFSIDDIYKFESRLSMKYPENNFIKEKIRQQLQRLRNRGFLEFKGKGAYRKL